MPNKYRIAAWDRDKRCWEDNVDYPDFESARAALAPLAHNVLDVQRLAVIEEADHRPDGLPSVRVYHYYEPAPVGCGVRPLGLQYSEMHRDQLPAELWGCFCDVVVPSLIVLTISLLVAFAVACYFWR